MYTPPKPLIERKPQRGDDHIKGGWHAIPQAVQDMVTAGELLRVDYDVLTALVERYTEPRWTGAAGWFPSHRVMAAHLNIAPNTALDSYRRLEGRRIIERDGNRIVWSDAPVPGAFVFLRRSRGRNGRASGRKVEFVLPDYEADLPKAPRTPPLKIQAQPSERIVELATRLADMLDSFSAELRTIIAEAASDTDTGKAGK